MAAPRHVDLIYSGVLGTRAAPVEEWAFGVSFTLGALSVANPVIDAPVLEAFNDAAEDAFAAWSPRLAGAVHLTRIRTVVVDDEGHYERWSSGEYRLRDLVTETGGGAGANPTSPYQISLAISLRTLRDDALGRGRFYLPAPYVDIEAASGRMTAGVHADMVASATSFCNDLNTAAEAAWDGRLCVASGGSITKGVDPALREVTEVAVGRVYDTMRSRRGELQEEYTVVPLAA